MIVNCFLINDALQLTPVAPETAAESYQKTDAMLWLDLQAFEPRELEEWLDKLQVRDLSRRLCLEAHDRSGFHSLKDQVFLVIPVLADPERPREVEYLAFLLRENLLLTLHRKSVLGLQQLATLLGSDAWLSERSIAGLVSAVMIDLSLESLRPAADLRRSILALEERMARESDAVDAEEILDLHSALLALLSVVHDQFSSMQELRAAHRSFFKTKDAQDYANYASANLKAASRSLRWLDGRLDGLHSALLLRAQDKTNHRLTILTILSAIFLPITLLAGIWGMNFENMPELKHPTSYPIAIGLMALIGSGMYLYFRRSGWLD